MKRRSFIGTSLGIAGSSLIGNVPADSVDVGTADPLDEIEILTDDEGVSHVYADDRYNLMYGNGYVQARDRLFQMDLFRLLGYGESASVAGPALLELDLQITRDLYSKEELQRQFDEASPTIKEHLRGFSAGINRRIQEYAASGELPGEFALLGRAPDPWKPIDTIAITSVLTGIFGVSGGDELGNAKTFAELTEALGREEAYQAYGDINAVELPDESYTTIDERDLTFETDQFELAFDEVSDEQLEYTEAALGAEFWGIDADLSLSESLVNGERVGHGLLRTFKFGSNAMAIDGEHTDSGRPIMGGGPQTGLFKPPLLYEIGLHGAGFDCVGIGAAGRPSIVIGRTPSLAWTVTSAQHDMVDTIAVELDPDDKYRYKWNDEWHEMESRTVHHTVSPIGSAAGGDPDARVIEQEVSRIVQAGDDMPVIAWNEEESIAWCQRTTTRGEELAGGFQWLEVGTTDSLDAFEAQLSEFPFSYNFHVAGEEETMFLSTGKIPDRNPDLDIRLPDPGSSHEWTAMRSGTGLGLVSRETGVLVNWNNAPAAGYRPSDMEYQWGRTHRINKLVELLREELDVPGEASFKEARSTISLDELVDIQTRAGYEHAFAPDVVPPLIRVARQSDDAILSDIASEFERWEARDYSYGTETWTDAERYDTAGMALYETVRRELQELVFRPKLGSQTPDLTFDPAKSRDPHGADHGATNSRELTLVDAINGKTDHDWFEGERDEVLRQALRRTAEKLEARFESAEPSDWRRSVHKSPFTPFGATKEEEIPMTNRCAYHLFVEPGADALAQSRCIMPPSNTGHQNTVETARGNTVGEEPDRLTSQLDRYVPNDFKPLPITREEVEAVATTAETLTVEDTRLGGPVEPVDGPFASSAHPETLLEQMYSNVKRRTGLPTGADPPR